MSETTSPKATIFPKSSSRPCYLVLHRLDLYLAQSPYLLFGVPGLTQGSYNIAFEIGDVACHQGGLASPGAHPRLSYRGGQDAALGASERLGTALVPYVHRPRADVRERQEAPQVRRFSISL